LNPENKVQFLQGNEACALGAIAAGVRFFGGYPITPATEIAEVMARELPKLGGVFVQFEDEIASIGAVIGASVAGTKAMTATSGPGFSLKQENLGYAIHVQIPCVVINVMRGGPSTGLPTLPSQSDVMQARWGTHGDHPIIALAPNSVRECFDLTVRAVNLSERFRIPVIILSDAIIGHVREKVTLPKKEELLLVERKKPTVAPEDYKPFEDDGTGIPPMANLGEDYLFHITSNNYDDEGFPATNDHEIADRRAKSLKNKIERYRNEIDDVDLFMVEDAEVVIVAYGSTSRSARRAVMMAREQGIKAGLFRLKTIWPFPYEHLKTAAESANHLILVEMNMSQLDSEVRSATHGLDTRLHGLHQSNGMLITPYQIYDSVKGLV